MVNRVANLVVRYLHVHVCHTSACTFEIVAGFLACSYDLLLQASPVIKVVEMSQW